MSELYASGMNMGLTFVLGILVILMIAMVLAPKRSRH